MSIYYECQFSVQLNLENRVDIYEYILGSEKAYYGGISDVHHPIGLLPNSRVDEMFYNHITDDCELTINSSDITCVEIDYLLGNKNRDNDIEYLIVMLIPYITKGYIILSNERIDWNKGSIDIYEEFKIGEIKKELLNIKKDRDHIPLSEIKEFIDEHLYNYTVLNYDMDKPITMYVEQK